MYFSKQFGKKYTENTRERKNSILEQNQHQYFNINFKCKEEGKGEMESGRKREGGKGLVYLTTLSEHR
jgi:hypothetical protein